jgi:hypothetical protein
LAFAELLAEPTGSFAGFGEKHQSADGSVDAVDEADKDVAWFGFVSFAVVSSDINQTNIAGLVPLDKQTGGLDDR